MKENNFSFASMLILFFFLVFAGKLFSRDSTIRIGALGDSISTGFNSGGWGDRDKKDSWTTGDSLRVDSHYKKIRKILGDKIEVLNVAVAGARVDDLSSQVDNLLVSSVDYLTILIGANDLCSWKDDYEVDFSKFKDTFTSSVERIIDDNSNVKIVLAPVPNLFALWQKGSQNSSCRFKWRFFGICKPLLSSKNTDEQRYLFRTKLKRVNDFFYKISTLYPDNIRYNEILGTYEFDLEHISKKDCFHPSISGQNLISNLTWDNGWYSEIYF
jgi:lysophospholipase L1-like esterase